MELLIYCMPCIDVEIYFKFKFQYGATNIYLLIVIQGGDKVNLNSNMELLISSKITNNFSSSARFKFQYGATNIYS